MKAGKDSRAIKAKNPPIFFISFSPSIALPPYRDLSRPEKRGTIA
jgi:hypothetical protein